VSLVYLTNRTCQADDENDPTVRNPRFPDGQREVLAPHRRLFGQRWFLLPNPMYGSWERVLQR
jgi:predicted secreted acid phosphatase